VFLDRDGVLNEAILRAGRPYPPRSEDEFRILPGVPESCHQLRQLGFLLVVVTNQPDIARGILDQSTVEKIHARLLRELPVESIWVCPHDDGDACDCRKPAPGLIRKAAARHNIDVRRSYLVGDRWRDIEAGLAVGCRTVLVVNPSYLERRPNGADAEVLDLREAAAWIAAEDQNHQQVVRDG
jgi:D-glycero-D-manno-heptose 1,7-bisphosphate phosphatase